MAIQSPLDDMDKDIVTLFQQGDKTIYIQLYDRYAPAIFGVLSRTLRDQKLAEEHLKKAFCRIWDERETYNPAKDRLFTWMLKITRNSLVRGPDSEKKYLEEEIHEGLDLVYGTDIKAYLQQKWRADGANFATDLEETVREAIQLIYFKSYSYAEVAEKLGMSVNTLMGKIVKAIKHLRGTLAA